jgi:hypothetical protein
MHYFHIIVVIIIAVIVYIVLHTWSETLKLFLFKYLKLNPELISSNIIIALIMTFILFVVIIFFELEAHHLFGVPDQVIERLKKF